MLKIKKNWRTYAKNYPVLYNTYNTPSQYPPPLFPPLLFPFPLTPLPPPPPFLPTSNVIERITIIDNKSLLLHEEGDSI